MRKTEGNVIDLNLSHRPAGTAKRPGKKRGAGSKKKGTRARSPETPTPAAVEAAQQEALLNKHEEEVREARGRAAQAIIDCGRRLIEAKRTLGEHGLWTRFIDERLQWRPSTVRMLMQIGSYPPFENADNVSVLPADQRSLVALAQIPAADFVGFLDDHGDDLSRLPRTQVVAKVRAHKTEPPSKDAPEQSRTRVDLLRAAVGVAAKARVLSNHVEAAVSDFTGADTKSATRAALWPDSSS